MSFRAAMATKYLIISDPTAKLILWHLADEHRDRTPERPVEECRISIRSLCHYTQLCRRTVFSKLAWLEAEDLIRRIGKEAASGRTDVTEYELCYLDRPIDLGRKSEEATRQKSLDLEGGEGAKYAPYEGAKYAPLIPTPTKTPVASASSLRSESESTERSSQDSTPEDPSLVIFGPCLRVMTKAGIPERQARSILGKWVKLHGSQKTIDAVKRARDVGAIDPLTFIPGIFKNQNAAADGSRHPSGRPWRLEDWDILDSMKLEGKTKLREGETMEQLRAKRNAIFNEKGIARSVASRMSA